MSDDETGALTGAALGRWCYENPNLAALTIEGLRRHAQTTPIADELKEWFDRDCFTTGTKQLIARAVAALHASAVTSTQRERTVPHEDCLNCRCPPDQQCAGVTSTHCKMCGGLGRIPHESGGYGINCPSCSVTSTHRGGSDA